MRFLMVVSANFRMGQDREDDYQENEPTLLKVQCEQREIEPQMNPRNSCDTLGWKTVFLFKYSVKFEHFNIVLNQKNLVPSVFYDYDHILPQEALLF